MWEREGKSPKVVVRTAETAYCFQCEGEAGQERWLAREEARRAPMRDWLMGAPLYEQRLLSSTREQLWREGVPKAEWPEYVPPTLVPWADTLDPEVATIWLQRCTDGGYQGWPPANAFACRRMAEALLDGEGQAPDVGAVFRQPGMPYPPVEQPEPQRRAPAPGDHQMEMVVDVQVGLVHLEGLPVRRRGRMLDVGTAAGLPSAYVDAVGLTIEFSLFRNTPTALALSAIGSVFRDDEGRTKVVWRNRERRSG